MLCFSERKPHVLISHQLSPSAPPVSGFVACQISVHIIMEKVELVIEVLERTEGDAVSVYVLLTPEKTDYLCGNVLE